MPPQGEAFLLQVKGLREYLLKSLRYGLWDQPCDLIRNSCDDVVLRAVVVVNGVIRPVTVCLKNI